MQFIKIFENFNIDDEIIKLVATSNNFSNWSETNKLGYNDFIKHIKSAIEGINTIPNKDILSKQSLDNYLSKIDAFKDDNIRNKVVNMFLDFYKKQPEDLIQEETNNIEFEKKLVDNLLKEANTLIEVVKPNFTRSTGLIPESPLNQSQKNDADYGKKVTKPKKEGLPGLHFWNYLK